MTHGPLSIDELREKLDKCLMYAQESIDDDELRKADRDKAADRIIELFSRYLEQETLKARIDEGEWINNKYLEDLESKGGRAVVGFTIMNRKEQLKAQLATNQSGRGEELVK